MNAKFRNQHLKIQDRLIEIWIHLGFETGEETMALLWGDLKVWRSHLKSKI